MRLLTILTAVQLISATFIEPFLDARTVPNSYIVELSPNNHFKRGFISPHEALYHDLRRRGATWEVTKEYSEDLFTGAAIKLASSSDLAKLAEVNGVLSITPNYAHSSPWPSPQERTKSNSGGTTPHDTLSIHTMTGVDKLHAEGYFGKGIKIGIIDTGIDYTHPALGAGFGPGHKIIGGYDFVGDNYTGMPGGPPPVPDDDPLDQCYGHGTHVAGIIGANPDNIWNISGVAYESEINAYRVFGCTGEVLDDVLIDALCRAYKDGNDVIMLSLGGAGGWAQSVSGVVASRIAKKGRVVTFASGNDGRFGPWNAGTPGTALDVISVASVDNTVRYVQNAVASNGRKIAYNYGSIKRFPVPAGHDLPVYATSHDPTTTNDACNPLPNNMPNLSKYLVLIRSGTCNVTTQLNNAAAKGGRYFFIYDNMNRPLSSIRPGNYSASLITQADGLFLLQHAIPNHYTVSFPNETLLVPNPTGGLVSIFSSYGPSYDMYLKPALAAPGGFILSTLPVALGSWDVKSGTSMATPFVAGSAALLLQIKGKNADVARAAQSIFQNSAVPVRNVTDNPLLDTASHQGAGLINVYNAVKNTGSLLPAEILLNDTANFRGVHRLKLNNGGSKPVTYSFAHVPAGTAITVAGIEVIPEPVPLSGVSATVEINPSQITVPAGSTLNVIVTIAPPVGLEPTTFPVYTGYIRAIGSDNTILQSTYIGVAAVLKDAKVLDDTDAHFGVKLPVLMDGKGAPVSPNETATYTMKGNNNPIVIYRLVQGTPLLQLDLMDSKANISTSRRRSRYPDDNLVTRSEALSNSYSTLFDHSRRNWLSAETSKPEGGSFAGVRSLGVLYREAYLPRNTAANSSEEGGYTAFRTNRFANGTHIPNGSYRILLRALKITGDPKVEGDFEVWFSPTLVVKRV
ncbi:unnamed protein product [Rhizoctonia solani]|uniref:Minor extracellular protease vpr n=1 Tax=Rhizoctonia solani TaxID=456999 RepID=A0A8H3DVN3_9AGAM|nr:unnamed protein product [Rhizoctonia solani]